MFRAFEEKVQLIELFSRLAAERGVQVMIGSESGVEEMRECSLVASTSSGSQKSVIARTRLSPLVEALR